MLDYHKILYELNENKHYLLRILLISFLTLLPEFITTPSKSHIITLLLYFILLIFISKVSKTLFTLFTIFINLINIFQMNIFLHWGGYIGTLLPRIEVATIAPKYEALEYLKNYLDYRDYFIIFYSLGIIIYVIRFTLSYKHSFKFLKKIALGISLGLLLMVHNKEPFGVIHEYLQVVEKNQIVLDREKYIQNIHIKPKNNINPLYDKVIIIQGESANKNHLHIYGYKFKTTPFLSKLKKANQIFIFNVIAGSNQTRYSVPMIFTQANTSNWEQNFIYSHSILEDFECYGYTTNWISNQGMLGKHENYITTIGDEATHMVFFNKGDMTEAKTDEVIVNYLKKIIPNNSKEFYVFHLIGSHDDYTLRYDNIHILNKNPKNIIEKYDNTIFYTDYIIKSIFEYFTKNNQKVLIIYLSDHGEVVSNTLFGHGFFPTFKNEYEAPLVIYSSIENKRINKLAIVNKKHFFNLENLNYIIEYISGISNENNISYSSKVFPISPKNIVDYNTLPYQKE